jgi:hypothetical protein
VNARCSDMRISLSYWMIRQTLGVVSMRHCDHMALTLFICRDVNGGMAAPQSQSTRPHSFISHRTAPGNISTEMDDVMVFPMKYSFDEWLRLTGKPSGAAVAHAACRKRKPRWRPYTFAPHIANLTGAHLRKTFSAYPQLPQT